jgi:membrane dipeptidase
VVEGVMPKMIDKALLERIRRRTFEALEISREEEERGLELHEKMIVFDSMCSIDPPPLSKAQKKEIDRMLGAGRSSGEIMERGARMQTSHELMRDPDWRREYAEAWERSGVTAINYSIPQHNSFQVAVEGIAASAYRLDELGEVIVKATCAEDVQRAKEEGKHAVMWCLQNTLPFGGGVNAERELDTIDLFHQLGVRSVQLTYNLRNFVGDGCLEHHQSGLTYFGLEVVDRMNRLGMLIDVSHCSPQTTLDAVEVSKAPVAATHAGCKGVYYHSRNKTDEELKAIAEKDGYVGIPSTPAFLGGRGTLRELLDHVDYAVSLIGVDHVGIGSDYGYNSWDTYPPFAERLREERAKQGTGSQL